MRAEALDVVEQINRAWLSDSPEDMSEFLRGDVVMVRPYVADRCVGVGQLIDSFREFRSRARIQGFETSTMHADVFGETAVVSYSFELKYELNGQAFRSTGRDVWVLCNEDGSWKGVWRTMADVEDVEL